MSRDYNQSLILLHLFPTHSTFYSRVRLFQLPSATTFQPITRHSHGLLLLVYTIYLATFAPNTLLGQVETRMRILNVGFAVFGKKMPLSTPRLPIQGPVPSDSRRSLSFVTKGEKSGTSVLSSMAAGSKLSHLVAAQIPDSAAPITTWMAS